MLQFMTDHLLAITLVGVCTILGVIFVLVLLTNKQCPVCKHSTCKVEFEKVVMSTDKPEQVTDFLVFETARLVCANPECSFASKQLLLLDQRYPTYADLKELLEEMQK